MIFSASHSGPLKSFFDAIDHEALTGKPVLIAATGGTVRHSLAPERALRPLFAHLRAIVLPTALYAASADWGGEDELAPRIARAARELAAAMLVRPLVGRSPGEPGPGEPGPGEPGREPGAPGRPGREPLVPFEQQLAALRVEQRNHRQPTPVCQAPVGAPGCWHRLPAW
ncbi:hypothetical protein GCM10010430_56930 [Kitasatospora cystarginea]|uniref:NADPH-dependent FMN reductase-like domain-containing protein n=1 Tax=Kitasatospora cystarginea TaxID=58350 RepID=A0ABN3EP88_9ACTN